MHNFLQHAWIVLEWWDEPSCKIDIVMGNCCNSQIFVLAVVHFSYSRRYTDNQSVQVLEYYQCDQCQTRPGFIEPCTYSYNSYSKIPCHRKPFLLLYNHSVSIIIEISFEIFSLICYKSNALIVFGEYEWCLIQSDLNV